MERKRNREILIFCCIFIMCTEPLMLCMYSTNMQMYFNRWKHAPYVLSKHDCSDMSQEVEAYVETQLGLDCYFVYGHRNDCNGTVAGAHIWTLIKINNKFYEFDSTCLTFVPMSKKYMVDDVQQGFYVDGVKYEKCQKLDNWKDLI